jgi:hypothetical protein
VVLVDYLLFEKYKIKHNWLCINELNFELCKGSEEIFSFAVRPAAFCFHQNIVADLFNEIGVAVV